MELVVASHWDADPGDSGATGVRGTASMRSDRGDGGGTLRDTLNAVAGGRSATEDVVLEAKGWRVPLIDPDEPEPKVRRIASNQGDPSGNDNGLDRDDNTIDQSSANERRVELRATGQKHTLQAELIQQVQRSVR